MDAEIRHARYIMSRLLLDCLRLIDEVRVRSGKLTNDEMIIGMAIIVLEYERRLGEYLEAVVFYRRAQGNRGPDCRPPSGRGVSEVGWSEGCVCASA